MSPALAEAVERCGLDLGGAGLFEGTAGDRQYQYIRIKRHPILSDLQMACLARLLVPADIGLRTEDEAFTEKYRKAWEKEDSIHERKLAMDWLATNRPLLKVPEFLGDHADLNDFVTEVEQMCNAPKGTALVSGPSNVYLPWPQEPTNEAACLFTVLTASNLNEHGIDVEWGGVP